MLWAIFYHLYILETLKNAEVCNFTESNNPPWVFFTFLKLYKWYQIAQNITYIQISANIVQVMINTCKTYYHLRFSN